MDNYFQDLLEISHLFGSDKQYVVAGGGNVSLKDEQYLYIKGSGFALVTIKLEEFAKLKRSKIDELLADNYDTDSQKREAQVKDRILACRADLDSKVRPSVETPFHHLLNYRFVVHTHPYIVNALCCSQKNQVFWEKLFKSGTIFVPYVDPGYILAKTIEQELKNYRQTHKTDPHIIFLENHGIIIGADTIDEIKQIYRNVFDKILTQITKKIEIENYKVQSKAISILESLKQIMNKNDFFTYGINNSLIQYFLTDSTRFKDILLPFNPDTIVYCKASPLILDFNLQSPDMQIQLKLTLDKFVNEWGYFPKIVLIPEIGMFGLSDTQKSAENAVEMFLDGLHIAYYSQYFGGPKGMSRRDINFIDNWEVEQFRRSIAK